MLSLVFTVVAILFFLVFYCIYKIVELFVV